MLLVTNAIQSVLDQSFQDFEIIIVDVSSSDGTRKRVSQFKDARIRYFLEKEDRGISATRNRGIKASRGEFIAFLDDDDIWLPNKLEKQLNQASHDPLVGVVYTGYCKVNGTGEIKSYHRPPFLKGNIFPRILEKNNVGGCSTVLVKKTCLDKSGLFDENFYFGEDFDLWIRLAKHCRFDYVRDPMVLYRVHQKSLTARTDAYKLLKTHCMIYEKYSKDVLANRRVLAAWNYQAGRLTCECGNIKQGRLYLRQAIACSPSSFHYYARLFSAFFGIRAFKLLSDRVFTKLRGHLTQINF